MQRLETLTALPSSTNFDMSDLDQHFGVIDRHLGLIRKHLKAGVTKAVYEKLIKCDYALQLAHKHLSQMIRLKVKH
jgi:hypothetical protein